MKINALMSIAGAAFVVTARMFGLVPLTLTDLFWVLFVASWGLFVLPELFMRRKIWRWQ